MKYNITKLDRQTKTSISAIIKCPDVEMANLALEALHGIDGLTTEEELYVQAVIRVGEYISYRVYSEDTHQQILAILDALDIGKNNPIHLRKEMWKALNDMKADIKDGRDIAIRYFKAILPDATVKPTGNEDEFSVKYKGVTIYLTLRWTLDQSFIAVSPRTHGKDCTDSAIGTITEQDVAREKINGFVKELR